MATIVDSINVVNSLEEAPDKLRAEIGRYYSPENRGPFGTSFAFFRTGIKDDFIYSIDQANSQLIPTTKSRIFLTGEEHLFRDQTQWSEYIRETINTSTNHLDHQFSIEEAEVESSIIKNFHNPDYEDLTKTYASNQLLNYNLINYPHKDKVAKVKNIGDLSTQFDDEDRLVNTRAKLDELFQQFPERISNYTGSLEEIDLKQRNIFILHPRYNGNANIDHFPYYYYKTMPGIQSQQNKLLLLMTGRKKYKNIIQAIKQDLSFSNRQFNIGTTQITGKIYNLINICTSSKILSITEQTNELFLVADSETDFHGDSRRFVEQFQAVQFLSDLRQMLQPRSSGGKSREIQDIFDSQPCDSFAIAYKIEKYLDNDAGRPIQTYYTYGSKFEDTQLKYGRQYIYKTKILIGVLGSSYRYSNLFVSQNETEMVNEVGVTPSQSPYGYGDIANSKYRAYVDVEVTPSFQILEYEIDNDQTVFVDVPPPPPQVEFFNNSKKQSIEFFFSPTLFTNQTYTYEGENQDLSGDQYQILTQEDEDIEYLLSLGSAGSNIADYFTGIYEVYRVSQPPTSISSFSSAKIATVDDRTSLTYPSTMELPPLPLDNMNGHFEDEIVSNTKYYYLFRALSYHGTPSNTTGPYEIELLKDSDEYKVMVKEYQYPTNYMFENKEKVKRIIRLVPNFDRLQFTELEKNQQGKINYKLDEGNMLVRGQSRKIKLRVTSKHTGKQIDINISLTLKEDTNSFI